jgi:hypothetical protein
MPPLSGNSSDAKDVGEVVRRHVNRLPTTYGLTSLVADSALYMASLHEGYRDHEWTSVYGGVEQRWWRIFAEHRQTQAQRSVDTQLRTQSAQEVKAFRKLCNTTCACAAAARQALLPLSRPDRPPS